MIETEASLVAAVEPVDHVLDALDVAPVGEGGAVGRAAGGDRGGGGWRLLRLHAACRTARQPGGRELKPKSILLLLKCWSSKLGSCQLEGQTIIFSPQQLPCLLAGQF